MLTKMQQWLLPECDSEACDADRNTVLRCELGMNARREDECGSGDNYIISGGIGQADKERAWQFTVLMEEELMASEKMAIVGNCKTLGNWQLSGCVVMFKGNDRGESTIMDDGM